MSTSIGLIGGTDMVRSQLHRQLQTEGWTLAVGAQAPSCRVVLVAALPEGLDAWEGTVRRLHADGVLVVLLLRETEHGLAERARHWPVAGVVLQPFRAQVLLGVLRDLLA